MLVFFFFFLCVCKYGGIYFVESIILLVNWILMIYHRVLLCYLSYNKCIVDFFLFWGVKIVGIMGLCISKIRIICIVSMQII